jgi:hypothetical protein
MDVRLIKTHRLLVIALLIALVHFLLTSIIGLYIAVQLGTQVGHVVAEGFVEAYKKSPQNLQKSEEEARRIDQSMKNKNENIIENWRVPLFLISLPTNPLMNPIRKNIYRTRFRMVVSKEISRKQFYIWGIVIDCIAKFVNSLSVGFLVYMILRIWRIYRTKRRVAPSFFL